MLRISVIKRKVGRFAYLSIAFAPWSFCNLYATVLNQRNGSKFVLKCDVVLIKWKTKYES